jgi:hypothetical protein
MENNDNINTPSSDINLTIENIKDRILALFDKYKTNYIWQATANYNESFIKFKGCRTYLFATSDKLFVTFESSKETY